MFNTKLMFPPRLRCTVYGNTKNCELHSSRFPVVIHFRNVITQSWVIVAILWKPVKVPPQSGRTIRHTSCVSTNLIYCITCDNINAPAKLYIDETGRCLSDRYSIRNIVNKPVAHHFNSHKHTLISKFLQSFPYLEVMIWDKRSISYSI